MVYAILVMLLAVDAARSSARAFHLVAKTGLGIMPTALPASIACLVHFLGTNTGRFRRGSPLVRPPEPRDSYSGARAAAALH